MSSVTWADEAPQPGELSSTHPAKTTKVRKGTSAERYDKNQTINTFKKKSLYLYISLFFFESQCKNFFLHLNLLILSLRCFHEF